MSLPPPTPPYGTTGDAAATTAARVAVAEAQLAEIQSASAVGVTFDPTTTSTSPVDLTDMSVTLTTNGGDLLVWFSGVFYNSDAGQATVIALSLDGATDPLRRYIAPSGANEQGMISVAHRIAAPSAASHTVKVQWYATAGTSAAAGVYREMVVMEITQ